jgi:protein SCO1
MTLVRALSVFGVWCVSACASREVGVHKSDARDIASSVAVTSPTPPPIARQSRVPAPSIHDLPIRLVDDSGTARTLASFRGHPVMITMFYGSCASACPLLTLDLKRIERALPPPVRANVRVLMVSFDAARDTPAVLDRLKRERGMDAGRWTLASAPEDDARELAGVLGIRYRKLDNGEFFHSSAIILLDAEGRPQVKLDGLGEDPAPVVAALTAPST